ncbi:unnamed protein product [Pleuronectes platessa]|uniref:Uncharacterized protein n=1 Tax=Pleuronectes platessa TaxID=8262 RepID=A0A9N7TVA3_PLEPL|nr:unnamed protein product [Pleuronectes platessa]
MVVSTAPPTPPPPPCRGSSDIDGGVNQPPPPPPLPRPMGGGERRRRPSPLPPPTRLHSLRPPLPSFSEDQASSSESLIIRRQTPGESRNVKRCQPRRERVAQAGWGGGAGSARPEQKLSRDVWDESSESEGPTGGA